MWIKLNINKKIFFLGSFIKFFFVITLVSFPTTFSYAQDEEYDDEEYVDEEYEDEEYEDEEYEDEEYEDEEYEDEEYEDEEYEDEEKNKKKPRKKKRTRDIKKKEVKPGFSIGLNSSLGIISGDTFSKVPIGATILLTTPFGFKVGKLDFSISAAIGSYSGSYTNVGDVAVGEYDPNVGNYPTTDYDVNIFGLGYKFKLANVVFAEGHPSLIGKGLGYRGFMGLSFEKFIYSLPIKFQMKDKDLFSSGVDMPFNILLGLEGFISSDIGSGNPSYWGGVGIRIDYNLKKAS